MAALSTMVPAAAAQAYDGECTPDFGAYARHIAHVTVEKNGRSAVATAIWLDTNKLITINRIFESFLDVNVWTDISIRRTDKTDGPSASLFERQERDKNLPRVHGRRFGILEKADNESVVVIELDTHLADAVPVTFSGNAAMQMGKPVFSVLYIDNGYWPQLRYAAGHLFKPLDQPPTEGGKKLDPGLLWAEMIQRPEPKRGRDVVGAASEGSPVFNCDGAVIGIITGGLTQNSPIGILPTAWGVPNVVGLRLSMMSAMLLERMK